MSGLSGGQAMLELAERCEKATGPDRDLDYAIARAAGWRNKAPLDWHPHWYSEKNLSQCEVIGLWVEHGPCPYFTASLDAALSLVPEDMVWSVDAYTDHAEALVRHLFTEGKEVRGRTPALALCAAALRARAADTPSVKPRP